MDYFTLHKEAVYLDRLLEGASVSKVYQGDRGITLKLRGFPLLFLNIVVDPEYSSFFLSDHPLFKSTGHLSRIAEVHFRGAKLLRVSHPKGERVFTFEFLRLDFTGSRRVFQLIFEVLGRQSNIILVAEGRILDAWYRREGGLEDRSIIPGRLYMPPEPSKGIYVGDVERDEALEILSYEGLEGLSKRLYPMPRFLVKRLKKEAHLSGPEGLMRFWSAFQKVRKELYSDIVWVKDLKVYPFSVEEAASMNVNDALVSVVQRALEQREFISFRERLKRTVLSRLKRVNSLKERLCAELDEGEDFERYRLWGEVILINMSRFSGGTVLKAENPYNPGEVLEIPIERNNPSATAQKYFALYSKAKSKREKVQQRLKEIYQEATFLEDLLWQIEEASSMNVLEDLEEVLAKSGYMKKSHKDRPKTQREPSYLKFDVDGFRLLVGKNSRANDYVTFKLADREDLWLHVKGYPGSHVVVKGKRVPKEVVEKAASIAAYFSRARGARKVEVDYTKVKYVRKGKPPRPGFVWYTDYATVVVEPKSPEEVLHVKEGEPHRNSS